MKKTILVKTLVITFFSIITGLYFYFDELKKSALGKDEFLKKQSIRFDNYLSPPHFSIVLAIIIYVLILFGLYELICYFIFKIVNKAETKSNSF